MAPRPEKGPSPGRKASRQSLRRGFSTGTAATAAAMAALTLLTGSEPTDRMAVTLPGGEILDIKVEASRRLAENRAWAEVIKDAGDDPDVTNRARIQATVTLTKGGRGVRISGGKGVGRVTRPGLDLEVGEPAINPVPREMITRGLKQVWRKRGRDTTELAVEVEIAVPDGERLARRTLNPRLGIVGGISILGTHGLVKPFSHEAYTATIDSALSVARAAGVRQVVLVTGGRSEKRARVLCPDLPDLAFVQIADFFKHALSRAARAGMERVGLVSFFGKAVKQAMGLAYTHAHKAPMELGVPADWLIRAGLPPEIGREIAEANTARHALSILDRAGRLDLVGEVGRRLLGSSRAFLGPGPELWAVIVDFDDGVLFEGSDRGEGS